MDGLTLNTTRNDLHLADQFSNYTINNADDEDGDGYGDGNKESYLFNNCFNGFAVSPDCVSLEQLANVHILFTHNHRFPMK